MIKPGNITLLTLGVNDLERAKNFYETALGWKQSPHGGGELTTYMMGTLLVSLYERHLLAEDAQVENLPTGFAGITLAHNAASEQEVDALMARAEQCGATILKPAQKVFWGGYSGYFRDPEGHLFELAHNPFWELDEDGSIKA